MLSDFEARIPGSMMIVAHRFVEVQKSAFMEE
jgi:hypothetical protein